MVRQLLERANRKEPDSRLDLLIDLGLILQHGAPIKVGEEIVLDKVDVEDPEYTIFLVHKNDSTVFEAMVTPEEIEIGHYRAGPWEDALRAVASIVRTHPAFS